MTDKNRRVANILDYLDFVEEDMMKGPANPRGTESGLKGLAVRLIAFAIVSCALIFLSCGCGSCEQPGETAAEGRRRHKRVRRINQQEMMADIDKLLLLDKPSKLTDKRIP